MSHQTSTKTSEATCEDCEEKRVHITALERVMERLDRNEDAFTWVGHERGLRKKITEIETKLSKRIGQLEKTLETERETHSSKRKNQQDDCASKERAIKRWKDNFHLVRKEREAMRKHWLIGWLNKRICMKIQAEGV